MFVYDSKLKKKKFNTPIKGKEVCRALSFAAFHNQDQNEGCENKQFELHNSYDSKDVTNSSDMTENFEQLSDLLPAVLQTLQEEGQLETYMKINNLLASQEFPTKNICYLLFLYLLDWYSCENTSRMRYRTETVQFWQIGYHLFHGKYLRFKHQTVNWYCSVLTQHFKERVL